MKTFSFVHALTVWCLADDNFRSKFLWGRKPMLAACAARLAERNDLVWVDVGGGTGVRIFGSQTPRTA